MDLIDSDFSVSDMLDVRELVFFAFFIFVFPVWAFDVGAHELVLKSLSGLNELQSLQGLPSCVKPARFSGQGSDMLVKMVQDDREDRLLIFNSMAPTCQSRVNTMRATKTKDIRDFSSPELLQKAYETNGMGYLGEYTHEAVKSCMLSSSTRNNDVISKFYYLAARLNRAAGQIAREQAIIDRYLNNAGQSECPNMYLLNAAYQVCKAAQSCAHSANPLSKTSPKKLPGISSKTLSETSSENLDEQNLDQHLDQLSEKVQKEEELYHQTVDALQKVSANCEQDSHCVKQKSALNAVLAGLLAKNPWFLNSDFIQQKSKISTKDRLEKYLRLAQENLKSQQALLEKASMCLHNSGKAECKIDDVREILALTPDLPGHLGGKSATERILDEYNGYQSCLEDGSLARNRASGVVSDATRNALLGLVVLPIGARWAVAKASKMVWAEATALVGADIAVNVMASRDSWKALEEQCFSSERMQFQLKTQNKNSPQKNICEDTSSALSQSHQESSSCLMNAGLAALSAMPFAGIGYNVVRYAQSSGIFKAATSAKQAATAAAESAESITQNVSAAGASASSSVGGVSASASSAQAPAGGALASSSARAVGIDVSSGGAVTAAAFRTQQRRVFDSLSLGRRHRSVLQSEISLGWKAEKNIDIAVAPNLPSSLKIVEVEKIDGSKALFYKSPEKLKDGTWVVGVHEFQLDEVSGAINANYPAGRELFTKIIQEKAGQAYFAFIDVGSLGFVNKQFKTGEVAGDRYLKGVADKIKELGAGKVTLARTGGDEFTLVVDEVDPAKAKALLEKIQKAIRQDTDGLAKRVFFEEQITALMDAKEALKRLEAQFPDGVPAEQKAQILKQIDDLSRVQQPDISIGITQIGAHDSFADLAARTEEQASKMKISSALQFGRSAAKYGSKEVPNAKPNSTYLAPVQDPIPSSSWKISTATAGVKPPPIEGLRVIISKPKEEVLRFSDVSVVRFEDELGRSVFKTERFITDAATGKRVAVISEIPTRGSSGLLDGTHIEGQRLMTSFIQSDQGAYFGMLKLRSLKLLNYLPSGTRVGDEILEVVGDLIKRNTRSDDLNFKLGGADAMMGIKNRTAEEMQSFFSKVGEQLKSSPKVAEVFARETAILTKQINEAKALGKTEVVQELQKRLQDLKNFDLDLQFQTLPRNEISANPSLKEIQKKFDTKFEHANKSK